MTVVRCMTVGNGGIVYAGAVYKIKVNRFTKVSIVFKIRNSYELYSKVTAACG